jgi:hypothetical protein
MMKTTELNGRKIQIKTGTIESTGNEATAPDSSTISGLTFTDGEAVRQTIMVEGSIVPYVSPGVTGTFLFTKGPKANLFLVAVDVEGRGLRVANPKPFRKVMLQAVWPMLLVSGFTAFCVLGAFVVPLMAPITLFMIWFMLKGVFTFTGLSKVVSIIKTIDRTRQIPETFSAPAALAAA